ncbi:hypothetical protein GCM10008944_01340 [Cytobacillus oceanisediminis]
MTGLEATLAAFLHVFVVAGPCVPAALVVAALVLVALRLSGATGGGRR